VNKELYGNTYEIPENILNNLSKYSGEKTVGNLLKSKKISYSNMKKMIHDMKNGEMENLGGSSFYTWLNNNLGIKRDNSETSKRIKKNTGTENAYLSSHEKDKTGVRSSDHKKASQRHATSTDNDFLRLESRVIEELKIINQLIKKII